MPVVAPTGRRVLLGQVAELVRGESPTSIARRSRQRIIAVTAGISGRDFGSVMSDVRARLASLPLPEGFSLSLGQSYEEQQRAYRQLSYGFLVVVALVYAVMAVLFEALLPTSLGLGVGAELQTPLARAVIGGFLLGTLVMLLFIPTLYVTVHEFRARRAGQAEAEGVRPPVPVAGGSAAPPPD